MIISTANEFAPATPAVSTPTSPSSPLTSIAQDSPDGTPEDNPFLSTSHAQTRPTSPSPSPSPASKPAKTSRVASEDVQHIDPKTSAGLSSGETQAESRTFAMSPYKLNLSNCTCQHPTNPKAPKGSAQEEMPESTNDLLDQTLNRLDKVLRRLCGMKPHREVRDAAMRITLELRERGWEGVHLVGYEGEEAACQSGLKMKSDASKTRDGSLAREKKKRRDFSVVFMVPGGGGGDGDGDGNGDGVTDGGTDGTCVANHRALAQLMIHVVDGGPHHGQLDHVGVRFSDDWGDWTVCQTHEYFRDANSTMPPIRVKFNLVREKDAHGEVVIGPRIGNGVAKPGEVREKVWMDVLRVLKGRCVEARSDFLGRLEKAMERLEGDGEVLEGYEVDLVCRKAKGRGKIVPAVRVPLYTVPLGSIRAGLVEEQEGQKLGGGVGAVTDLTLGDLSLDEANVDVEAIKGAEVVEGSRLAAVVVIDISESAERFKVKHIAVIYDGEWPITHHYRRNTPAPDLAGLGSCVRA